MPTAPAPMMAIEAGTSEERSTSSLVTMRSPSGTSPGRLLTRLPVARMVSVEVSTRSPLGWSWSSMVATRMRVAPSSVAVPRI